MNSNSNTNWRGQDFNYSQAYNHQARPTSLGPYLYAHYDDENYLLNPSTITSDWNFITDATPTCLDPTNQSPLSSSTVCENSTNPFEVPYGNYLSNNATQHPVDKLPTSGSSGYYQADHNAGTLRRFSNTHVCPSVIGYGTGPEDATVGRRTSQANSSDLSSPELEAIPGGWDYSNPSEIEQIDTIRIQRKDPKVSTGTAKKHHKRSKTQGEPFRPPSQKRSTPSSSSNSPVVEPSKGKSKRKTTRSNHNQVEKQYRTRLNAQFENLLTHIPKDSDRDRRVYEDGPDKRVSKSEVLILAQKAIKELEAKEQGVETENERLTREIIRLKQDFLASGGLLIPS